MDERTALKNALAESPLDDAVRLVFADWLEEHGESDWAEFIRVQVELARDDEPGHRRRLLFTTSYDDVPDCFVPADVLRPIAPDVVRWTELLTRDSELGSALQGRLEEEFPAPEGAEWDWHGYRSRGAPGPVKVRDIPRFLRSVGEARKSVPISAASFADWAGTIPETWAADLAATGVLRSIENLALHSGAQAKHVRAILHRPELTALRSLYLSPDAEPQETMEALAEAENLTGLRRLRVSYGQGSADGRKLLHNPALRELRHFEFSMAYAGDDKADLIWTLSSAGWDRLEELRIWDGAYLDDELWRTVASAEGLSSLRSLSLSAALAPNDVEAVLCSPTLARLDDLWMCRADLARIDLRLSRTTVWPPLKSLDLYDSDLRDGGVRSLANWPGFAGLCKLSLEECRLGRGLKALTTVAPNLRTLVLRECGIGPTDVRNLSRSPLLGSLLALSLERNEIGRTGAIALAESPQLDNLAFLVVDREKVGTGWEVLQERFGERLRDGER